VSLSFWWQKSYLGWLRGGEICGVEYEADKWEDYKLIVNNLDVIIPLDDVCIVSAHPSICNWSNAGLGIHCETGPAVRWPDGDCLWAIDGYLVPEKVVMEPETQTIEEISSEENAEVKRIRITSYGWSKFVEAMNAEVLDSVLSGSAWETLLKCGEYVVLFTYDPSTGRPYDLEVEDSCKTCEEAQRYLLAPDVVEDILGLKEVKTYPSVRT
jgi:hypothetical protein